MMPSVPRRSGIRFVLLAVFVCGLAGSAFAQRPRSSPTPKSSPSPSATPTPPPQYALPDPVTTVNGQPISKTDLEHFTEMYMNAAGRSLKTYSLTEQRKAYRAMLDSLIVDRLVSAQAAGVKVESLDITKRFEEVRKQYADQAAFEKEIARTGQTVAQVEQSIRSQIAREKWMEDQIKDQVAVTPQEVQKFYHDGPPDKFDEPERVSASHILLALRRDAPPEETLAVEKRANELIDRLKTGESFDVLAEQNSADPTVKKNKGVIGSFSREGVMPEFADAAFKMKVGEISAPVRTQFGYHIIKVTARNAAHTLTFDEAKARITTYIEDQKRQAASAQVILKLHDEAKIEIAPELRGDAPTASPAR